MLKISSIERIKLFTKSKQEPAIGYLKSKPKATKL